MTEQLIPADTPELEPDPAELVDAQDEVDPWLGVQVDVGRVRESVRVRSLPHKGLACREYTVVPDGQGDPVRILPRDPRRAIAWITSNSVFTIAGDESAAASAGFRAQIGGFGLPAFPLTTIEEVWASAAGGGGPVLVWVVTEQWAE